MIPDDYKNCVVLVVEDTDMMRVLMTRHLRQGGFESVLDCVNGREALAKVKDNHVDLILLDINMPEMDGYETLTALKADPKLADIPVIMITAVDKIESVAKCIEIGAEDYMPKLFNPILLNCRIRACLENRRLKKRLAELEAGH